MNKTLRHVLSEASGIAGDWARVAAGAPLLPFAIPVAAVAVSAIAATSLTAGLATMAGRGLLSELRRRARLREPLPAAPSLRGAPTPAELAADWFAAPRTLAVRLRLGSRMADLAPILDASNHYKTSATGAKRIASRGSGFKGWLADRRIPASYGSLMRYKRLAIRLRSLLRLDERLPLEWLLPHEAPDQPLPAGLRSQYVAARRRLSRLLRDHRNFSNLQKHVEEALGIPRLATARHLRTAPLDGELLESTLRELASFLRDSNLPPRREKLRRAVLAWFR